MADGIHRVWQFKKYFLACAIYSGTCTVLMILPPVGIFFCWPAILAMMWIEPLLSKVGVSVRITDVWNLQGSFSARILIILSLYSLVLFLPMVMHVIRPRKYWASMQIIILTVHPLLGALILSVFWILFHPNMP